MLLTHTKRGRKKRRVLSDARLRSAFYTRVNSLTGQEAAEGITYAANELNQYTRIATNGNDFLPEYDADGNQTLAQTSSGILRVAYNAHNRAVRFENEAEGLIITCLYDSMGRRFEKRVEQHGQVTLHQRYLYRDYLQIAAFDLTRANQPALWFITWDPTQPVATRPLAIRTANTWYIYGWDLTKNITELYTPTAQLDTDYVYTPYGLVRTAGNITQPIQWSSEFADEETGLIYYNFRYYNPQDGRWTRRDPIGIEGGVNLYAYVKNASLKESDQLGNSSDDDCTQKCQGASRCRKAQNGCCEKRTKNPNGVQLEANGCGAASWSTFEVRVLKAVTIIVTKVDFTPACNRHDECYGTCGANRALCDMKFLMDLRVICSSSTIPTNTLSYVSAYIMSSILYGFYQECMMAAHAYYAAVALEGEEAYESAQDQVCEWENCSKS